MALIHKATLTPTKLELLTGWLPSRPWAAGSTGIRSVGAYRFDDPAGAVGIESLLVQAEKLVPADGLEQTDGTGGPVLHVPLTYRAEPLAGAEAHLIGTIEHSVLGTRWVYDGCGDPIWAAAVAEAVLTGGTQVEELVDPGTGGPLQPRPSTATVQGSGTPGTAVPAIDGVTGHDGGDTTVVRTVGLELVVVRVVGAAPSAHPPVESLTGRWAEGGPAVLVTVRPV